jgi:hypothetical protein
VTDAIGHADGAPMDLGQALPSLTSVVVAALALLVVTGPALWAIAARWRGCQRRAILLVERPRGSHGGAAMCFEAGPLFVAAVRNAGPHVAEAVRVSGALGPWATTTLAAPAVLPPFGAAQLLVMLVPGATARDADVLAMLGAGAVLQLRIDFVDGTPSPKPVIRCFAFRILPGHDADGRHWVSRRTPCVAQRPVAVAAEGTATDAVPAPLALEPAWPHGGVGPGWAEAPLASGLMVDS